MRWKLALTLGLCLAGPLFAQPRPDGDFGGGWIQSHGTLIHFLLLEQPSVQQELRALEDQLHKARQVAANQRQKLERLGHLPRDEAMKKLMDVQKSADQGLQEILSPEQFQRLRQIGLQQIGPLAIGRLDVAEAVGLSADQQQQVRALQEKLLETSMQSLQPGGGRPRSGGGNLKTGILDAIAKLQEAKRDTETKILAVLSEEQKQKWTQAQGAPFRGALNLGPLGGRTRSQ